MLTAEQILKKTSPEQLFSSTGIKHEYREIALKWHPDKCKLPLSSDVLAHVNMLYKIGLEKIEKGYWGAANLLELTSVTNRTFRVKYEYHTPFDLGEIYVGHKTILYMLKKEYKVQYLNMIEMIKSFTFSSEKMRETNERLLPKIKEQIETDTHYIIVLEKTKDVVPLRAFLTYFKGEIPPKHVAWIISRLYNLACYIEHIGVVHQEISLDTCFVSYEFHSVLLLGGWWYAAKKGVKMKYMSQRTYDEMLPSIINEKKIITKIDLILIKKMGRELLGDAFGSRLRALKEIPDPYTNWLIFPSGTNAVKEFSTWANEVLPESYGERKFIKLEIPVRDIYDACKK